MNNIGLLPVSRFIKAYLGLKRRLTEWADVLLTANSMRYLSGKKRIALASSDVVVVCLIKNGHILLDAFLHHHRGLGIRHFVFVDNGSTDCTLELLSQHSDVTVYTCALPAKKFECYMRRWAMRRFAMNRWCLCVDADEFFDYLHADSLALSDFVRYLDEFNYTCVVTQMLDMFPDGPILATNPSQQSTDGHDYYDLSRIDAFDYHACSHGGMDFFTRNNSIGSSKIKWLFGGIRLVEFGAYVCLTKHSLLRISYDMVPCVHPHCSSGVRCADVSAFVRHYKFVGEFRQRIEQEVQARTWQSGDTEKYLEGIQNKNELTLKRSTAQKFIGAADLQAAGFLVSSDAFERWVEQRPPRRTREASGNSSA